MRKARYGPTAPMMATWFAARSLPSNAAGMASSLSCSDLLGLVHRQAEKDGQGHQCDDPRQHAGANEPVGHPGDDDPEDPDLHMVPSPDRSRLVVQPMTLITENTPVVSAKAMMMVSPV